MIASELTNAHADSKRTTMVRVPGHKHPTHVLKRAVMARLRLHLQAALGAGFSRLEILMPLLSKQQRDLLPQRARAGAGTRTTPSLSPPPP